MNFTSSKIRFPVLAFPIAGLVAALAALTPGIGINPEHDPAGFAKAANLVGLANLAGLIAFVLLLFGFHALYGFLADSSAGRWALAGMMFSVAGAALFASFLGILAFVAPVAGRMYLDGQMQAIGVISEATSPSNPEALAIGGASIIFYVIGSILFSVAAWRSGKLPKWSAIPYAIQAPLNVIPHYIPVLWFIGGILLLGAGAGLAMTIWKAH